jgi:hypothetical protein
LQAQYEEHAETVDVGTEGVSMVSDVPGLPAEEKMTRARRTAQKPYRFKQKGNKAETSTYSFQRVKNEKDLIRVCEIDINEWAIDHWICEVYEAQRKNKQVDLTLKNGVMTGSVYDQGKTTVTPLYLVKAWLVRRVAEIRKRDALDQQLKDAKAHAFKYRKPRYRLGKQYLYEVDFFDMHFGKLAWREESGDDYDVKIAKQMALSTLDTLLGFALQYKVGRIVLPIGNDFFNVDNKNNLTTHGTPQQEDTRWQKTFRLGRQLCVEMIDRCAMVAPVDVLIVPGNHDEERSFYLGEALESWYHKCKFVGVDNSAKKRKYYTFGQNLIGFTHGYYEKLDKLPFIMPVEVPKLWAASKFREWHLGDKHHKKDLLYRTEDKNGVTIRLLRSLSATDSWHFDKGFIGGVRAAEGFLWDRDQGLVGQFNAVGK